MKKKFEVEFLEEAYKFLQDIEKSASKKIIYNIDKSQQINDVKLFKKLVNTDFGSLEPCIIRPNIECWHFGIKEINKKY